MEVTQTGPAWPHLDAYERFPAYAAHRPVLGTRGMVSSPHAMASAIGADVLKAGGNAVDAAIATSAALMAACPMQGGPGGDAFWLVAMPDGEVFALDASGRASHRADPAALRAKGLERIPARSALAVTTPGAIDGWCMASQRFGTMPLGRLLEPAAALAEAGPVVSRHIYASFRACEGELAAKGALALWGGRVPQLYERLAQPALAGLLRGIGREGRSHFYRGEIARSIARAIAAGGGWLDEADLDAHGGEWVAPIRSRFRDVDIFTTPPSTQGFGLFAALGFVEQVQKDGADRFSPASVHLELQAVAAALAARDAVNDDRERLATDIAELWSDARRRAFAADFETRSAGEASLARSDLITRGDTAHLCVVDEAGMAVSLIQSLFFDFGSCIPVPEGGFVLQNRGAAFNLAGDVARLAPGKHPPTTLMPTIVTRGGKPAVALGCMGGDGQMQTQLQLVRDLVDGGLDPQQAVSRPRWYLDRSPQVGPRVVMETGLDEEVITALRALGYDIAMVGRFDDRMGHAQIITIADGILIGAADPRSDGQVSAF